MDNARGALAGACQRIRTPSSNRTTGAACAQDFIFLSLRFSRHLSVACAAAILGSCYSDDSTALQTTWLERGAVRSRVALLLRSSETRPLFARFVRLDPPGSNPPSLSWLPSATGAPCTGCSIFSQVPRMHRLLHLLTKCPDPRLPLGGPIEESLGADRVVVSPTGHPSLQGSCKPSRVSAQGCEGATGAHRLLGCAQIWLPGAAATGNLRWLQVRPLQEHCAAAGGWCLLQGYAIPL